MNSAPLPAMPASDDGRHAAWWQRMRAAPHAYDLFHLMRWLDAASGSELPLGHAVRLRDEPVRFGQQPSLAFAPAMVASVHECDETVPRVAIHGFGLFGPNGPLPLHLTEYARERATAFDDPVFPAFADLFHHRLIVLFYRAWADAQPAVSLDRPAQARFDGHVGSLIGRGASPHTNPYRPALHAQYFQAGHLVRHTRNPEGLIQILRRYFGVPVRIVEHVPRWVRLAPEQCCAIRATARTQPLGAAVLGRAVRDGQSHFRLVLGPLSLAQYRLFLPGGEWAHRLAEWVREYLGIEFAWDVQLELAHDEVPALALGDAHGLGRSAWVGRRMATSPARDLVLDPAARRARPDASSVGRRATRPAPGGARPDVDAFSSHHSLDGDAIV
jgi:type VI secretion system protein ImpH